MATTLKYKEELQAAFDREEIQLFVKVYFGEGSFVKVEEIWETTYKEQPLMHIVYFVANKLLPRDTLDKNLKDFLSATGIAFPFSILLIPISFYREDVNVNETSYNEKQITGQDS